MFRDKEDVKKYLVEYHNFDKDNIIKTYDCDPISENRSSFLRYSYVNSDYCLLISNQVIINKRYNTLCMRSMKIKKILKR